MDVRDLQFDDESFDIAIDKGLKFGSCQQFTENHHLRYHGRNDDIQGGCLGTYHIRIT
jgi:hypothetical protein